MKLIRYLKEVKLLKSTPQKQSNGTYVDVYVEIEKYKVQQNTLNDEVSATIYGSNVVKMLSIGTALGDLESFLQEKVNNKEDNISLYFIKIKNSIYKIRSVTDNSVVIERLQ